MKRKSITTKITATLWGVFFCLSTVTSAYAAQSFRGQELQVSYPEGWTPVELSQQVNFYANEQGTEWVQVDIDSPDAFAQRSTVDIRKNGALDKMIAIHRKMFKNFKLRESQAIDTPGRRGYFFVFTSEGNDPAKSSATKQAVMDFVQGGKVYLIQFVASPEAFDENWPSAKIIFDSVEVVS